MGELEVLPINNTASLFFRATTKQAGCDGELFQQYEGNAMIRVLQVIGAMDRGGAEAMIMNLYRVIDRRNVQFDFLVHEQRECDFDEEIRELGGKIYRLPRLNGLNYFSYRRLCRQFFAEHSEHPVVHGHIGSSAAIYLGEAKRAGRVAIAHSHAQSFLKGVAKIGFNAFSYPTRYVADWFIGCSYEAGRDRFGEKVVEGDRFFILNNGIDVELYRCNNALHEAAKRDMGLDGVPVVGHVGRFAPEKNHSFLLEAFAYFLKSYPSAVLMLIGRGPLEDDVKRRAREMGVIDSVRFMGVRNDVPDLLRAMDVFVFPSIKEGFSLAAAESQAAGLPVLLSMGVPEHAVITDKAKRIPLSMGAEKWAAAMRDAFESASGKPRVDCVDQVRAHGFDVRDTADRLLRFYVQLAQGEQHASF